MALAYLKTGEKPADAARLSNITYAAALKLKKELHAAEKKDDVQSLFKLDKAALELLLDSIKQQLVPAIDAFGIADVVETEIDELKEGVDGGKLLNQEFQDSAKTLSKRITSAALTSTNAETILSLSKALCELQRAFFGSDVGGGSANLPASSFEQHLRR